MEYSVHIGLLGVAAITMCWGLAIVLFRVGPTGGGARKLSVLLVIEGLTLLTAGFPEMIMGLERALAFYEENPIYDLVSMMVHHLGDAGMIALYPPFLAVALGTALTRPFANRMLRRVIAVVAVLMAFGTLATHLLMDSMAGSAVLYFTVMLTFLFAFVAAIDAWRRADSGIARTRAGLFALAFGIRDVCWCFAYAGSFWMIVNDTFDPAFGIFWWVKAVYALGTLLAVPLIAYGILRAHLFDIDLKIRWTIKQSTMAALILSFIFLVSEGASTFLSAELGTVAGLLAAAVVIFFLAPLQRFAERVAATAMPNTENTPEYIAFRKLQVYEAALTDAMAEGGISAKERALLAHLQASLGIADADARAIEQELAIEKSDPAPVGAWS